MNLADFIGIPYAAKGRSADAVDCWGCVQLFQREILGNEVPSYVADYSSPDEKESVVEAIEKNQGNWLQVDEPEFGDVIVFRLLGLPIHCAVYIGDGDFLHSLKGCATCVERLSSITWNKRIYGIFRWHKT